jgi:signal transduction histidine kinase
MRRPARTTVVALVVAVSLALLEVFRTTVTRLMEGSSVVEFDFAHRVLPLWITIVISSPWCAFMAWRYPLRAGAMGRTLAAHVAGGAIFVAIHLGLMMGYHWIAASVLHAGHAIFFLPSGPHLLHLYFFYIGMELSVYAAIVIVLLLLETRREATERALTAARLERSVTAARLESLQAQIRPHFLFNTLNTLAVLARKGDGAAVDRAIGDLGELLRASFESPGRNEIPLGEDLAFLEGYLNLQRLRFPDRLSVEWAISDEARAARIPVLMVQPLLENAIEHGLASTRGGHVRVTARRDGGSLELEVEDDGPGFEPGGTLAPGPDSLGVGLANTRERLALLYGDRGSLECSNRVGGGGRVRLRIPWRVGPAGGVAA